MGRMQGGPGLFNLEEMITDFLVGHIFLLLVGLKIPASAWIWRKLFSLSPLNGERVGLRGVNHSENPL